MTKRIFTTLNNESNIRVAVPGYTADDGLSFLEGITAGNVGAGIKMTKQGHTIPQIRHQYKYMIEKFEADLVAKKASGLTPDQLARWAVKERTCIAQVMRAKQGGGAHIILELRDNVKYGFGGRSYDNLGKRATVKGIKQSEIPHYLLKNATRPNKAISDAALKGAKFLKHGGRVVVVLSISATAYTLLTAPEDKLEKILYEELGGAAGGFVGGGIGVGLCILFGIATAGWGLLACGVVGGGVGGIIGTASGNKVFLFKEEYIRNSAGIVHGNGFEVGYENATKYHKMFNFMT